MNLNKLNNNTNSDSNIIQQVELLYKGQAYNVFLTKYELDRSQCDPTFLDELCKKYEHLHNQNLVTAKAVNEDEVYENTRQIPQEAKENDIWDEKETRLLISFYREHSDDFEHAKKKKHVWVIISEKLAAHGVNKSAEKCQRKWLNLIRVYRSVKDKQTQSGQQRIIYKYFEALDEVLGSKPSNSKETYIADVGVSISSVANEQENLPLNENNTNATIDRTLNGESSTSGSTDNDVPKKKPRKNYNQDYLKARIEYLKHKQQDDCKQRRHEERMKLEMERNDLLRKILQTLSNTS